MQKRLTRSAAVVAALLAALAFATPAFAISTAGRWMGFYIPGVPGNMTGLSTVQSKIGTQAGIVNFFITDTEAFPQAECSNVVASGATPMITLEFLSTQSGGLAAINNGSKDAYIRSFADAAKAFGQPVCLRPFHEMNGNWYPWCGGASGNSPAKSIAAWRRVHNIFAAEGATNVKFVWCPNVDFNVSSYYPGDAYVDYAAIDGYNNGSPWRSFSNIFGTTYAAVAAATSRPIFIAETGCVEGGTGKAAWIADMFKQIGTKYTRIVGVCWFDANLKYDWRVDSSASSVSAVKAGVASPTFLLIRPPARVHASISIKSNVKSVKCRHRIKLSGALAPHRSGSSLRVVVYVPKHAASSRIVKTSSSGAWSLSYTPTVRGTYHVKVIFAGDSARLPVTSKTIRLAVK